MARAQLEKGEQARFLQAVKDGVPATWEQIAAACQVDRCTMLAWRNEEWRMSYEALVTLSRLSGVPTPRIIEIISDEEAKRRSAIAGGRAVQQQYGCPLTKEARSRGGQTSQQRRREHPELYADRFTTRKPILTPPKSPELAELVGILLGDGSIYGKGYQIVISSNLANELQYSESLMSSIA